MSFSNEVNFTFELLVNASMRTVREAMKSAVTSARKRRFVVMNVSGDRAAQGDVNCADGTLGCDDLLALFASPTELSEEQRKALKQPPKQLVFFMANRALDANRAWKLALEKHYAGVSVQAINGASASDNLVELTDAISQYE